MKRFNLLFQAMGALALLPLSISEVQAQAATVAAVAAATAASSAVMLSSTTSETAQVSAKPVETTIYHFEDNHLVAIEGIKRFTRWTFTEDETTGPDQFFSCFQGGRIRNNAKCYYPYADETSKFGPLLPVGHLIADELSNAPVDIHTIQEADNDLFVRYSFRPPSSAR